MNVSFNGIGQWCATFLADSVTEGAVVKISDKGTVAPCSDGDAFCGVIAAVGDGACTVQMGGFATLSCVGAMPALGYSALSADGNGGIKGDDAGEKYWVVASNAAAKTVTILL